MLPVAVAPTPDASAAVPRAVAFSADALDLPPTAVEYTPVGSTATVPSGLRVVSAFT